MNVRLCLFLMVGFLSLGAAPSSAQNKPLKKEPLAVTSAVLHANLPKAEICVAFNTPLNIKDRGRLLSGIGLKKEGKKQKISAEQLGLTAQELCIQGLDHRAQYDLTLQRLESATGTRLRQAYVTSFFVPDRKPLLTFVEKDWSDALPRHIKEPDKKKKTETEFIQRGMAHVVRSVNVLATHLSLYRISDPSLFSGAWQQFKMINIAPSESLYFAQKKGQLVFESDLVFGDSPNVEQTLVAPLPQEEGLTPGLYYLAATPRGKVGTNVNLLAGQWFLVSDLRMNVAALSSGLQVFVANGEGEPKPQGDVSIIVLGQDGKTVVEAKTRADGTSFIPLTADNFKKASLVVAQKTTGDMDIFELKAEQSLKLDAAPVVAKVISDEDVYKPGTTAVVWLRAENSKGQVVEAGESVIRLLRSDHKLYREHPVAPQKTGLQTTSVLLPLTDKHDTWFLAWHKTDGTLLGEKQIIISPYDVGGQVDLQTDKLSLGGDATLDVALRITDGKGNPDKLRSGWLVVNSAEAVVDGWKAFSFGNAAATRETTLLQVPFMTNEDGVAHVSLSYAQVKQAAGETIEGISLQAKTQNGLSSAVSVLPLRFRDSLIGIKPASNTSVFSENSIAAFDVIAIDVVGKRRAEENLFYVVYEEGRSFKWFPSEGHWDYEPLPEHRRIGGGAFSVPATSQATIQIPVLSGHYVLEITSSSGEVLARYSFDVGRRTGKSASRQDNRIKGLSIPEKMTVKQEGRIKIDLSEPAMASLLVTDGNHVFTTVHKFLKAGMNEIHLKPDESWGRQVLVRAEVQFFHSLERAVDVRSVGIENTTNDLLVKVTPPDVLVADTEQNLSVQTQKNQTENPAYVLAVITPLGDEGNGDEKPAPVVVETQQIDADGKADIKLHAPLFTGNAKVTVVAWNQTQMGTNSFIVPVRPSLSIEAKIPHVMWMGDKVGAFVSIISDVPGVYTYEVSPPPGVSVTGKLKGSVTLKKGSKQIIPLGLSAVSPVDGALRFDVKDKAGKVTSARWPLWVRTASQPEANWQGQSLPPEQLAAIRSSSTLISPVAIPDISPALMQMLYSEPRTTEEIALWIEASQSLKPMIKAIGGISEERIHLLRKKWINALERRQNDDGGFAVLKAGGASDLVSTAAVLRALNGEVDRPVALGAEWLTARLQNTWFDEHERFARAYAFQALSKIKRLDIAGLRYFAETSRGQTLSVSGAALLGLALVQSGDEAAARHWMDSAGAGLSHMSMQPTEVMDYLNALRAMARNDKVSPDDLKRWLAAMQMDKVQANPVASVLSLVCVEQIAQRVGSWRIRLDDKEIKHTGLFVIAKTEEMAPEVLVKNASPNELMLYHVDVDPAKTSTSSQKTQESITLQRTLYTMSGEKIADGVALSSGQTYFLVIKGTGGKGTLSLAVPRTDALMLKTPVYGDADALRDHFAWLPPPLVPVKGDVATPTAFSFQIDGEREWSVALMLKPEMKGEFVLPPLQLRAEQYEMMPQQNQMRFVVE